MVLMRACAILGCKRSIAVTWNILYVFYTMVILGVVFYFFTHGGRECLHFGNVSIYHGFLPAMQFYYLDETGVCILPAPCMSSVFLISLISFLDFVSQPCKFLFPPRHVKLLQHCILQWTILFIPWVKKHGSTWDAHSTRTDSFWIASYWYS